MSGGPLVEAEGLAKWYRTRLRRDWLLFRPLRRRQPTPPQAGMWALEDVSLRLDRGRSLGIVGDNGAGKTTLLRIIAGISRPTRGSVTVRGEIASRFGYGLAFNPYLSGRENVFLEGTLLGMTNGQVRAQLDSIINFAGLDGAIDRPLWTYSSGMIGRLGFAIATTVQSELLLLDEAFSAGDGGFRLRGEELLTEARRNGRSLVVVSHGMPLVRKLCDEGLWLDHGTVQASGLIDDVVDAYETSAGLPSSRPDPAAPVAAAGAVSEADAG